MGSSRGQARGDVGQSHERARVAARDRSEQIQVDLDVVGEKRLRERGVVERRRPEQRVDGDEAEKLRQVVGQAGERSKPVRRPVLPHRRDPILRDPVGIEVSDVERPVGRLVFGPGGDVVDPHTRQTAKRAVRTVRRAPAERDHLSALREPGREGPARTRLEESVRVEDEVRPSEPVDEEDSRLRRVDSQERPGVRREPRLCRRRVDDETRGDVLRGKRIQRVRLLVIVPPGIGPSAIDRR